MMPQSPSNPYVRRWVSVELSRLLRGHPVLQSEILLALAILLSLICGSTAVALHRAIELLAHLRHTSDSELSGWGHGLFTLLTPATGGLLAGLLLH